MADRPFHSGLGIDVWLNNVSHYSRKVLALRYFNEHVTADDVAALERAAQVADRIRSTLIHLPLKSEADNG